MELSSSLLKEFAEETNDSEEVTSRSTAYGTIVRSGARTYVQLDGSDQLTAITEGTNVEEGDRVIVTIENHTATVTTNLSVPATGRITETMVEEGMIYGYFDVLEAQFASIENLEANYITAKEINAEYASFTYLAAEYASFEDLYAAFASFDYVVTDRIDAEVANINEAFIGYAQIIDADIQNLYAATATIDDLTATVAKISEAYISYEEVQRLLADYATISRLEAETAEIQTAFIEYAGITTADIEELFADLAIIQETYITQATINELLAGYATISDLQVTYANIETLSANIANISNVLAGNVGTGDLQTIYLTSDNAVIDSAVIVDALIGTVLADVIQSNIIYTDQITIMSEDGGIYIVGNQMRFSNGQIQFYDDNGVCRLQIGQDASGNFTFVLYDETGTGIMIDSEGIHESAVPDGLIVDSMVAEDANIAASKIDMADVISYINDSGDLVMDAYQIYIDGERLDYKLTTITESAVTEVINYYALGPSPYEPPCDPDDSNIVDAICGIAICGLSYTSTVGWTTTPLYSEEEGLYVWYVQKKIYIDGSYSWTEPTCLTDQYTRTKTSTMMTELEVVQGEIAARIWQTDIEEATGVLGDQIITITDSYSELTVTVDEIEERVASLTTSYGENFEYLYSQMAEITVQLGEIDLGVSQSISYIYDELESISSEGIKSRTAYFAVSYSPDYYPDLSGDLTYSSVCGIAICGLAVVGNSGYWTTEQPTPSDGEYVWITWLVETIDGETYWEDPILLTDYLAREQISYMSSQISGMQILIDEIDIGIQNVYSYVDNEIEVVGERVAEFTMTLDEINMDLNSLQTVVGDNYEYFESLYSGITVDINSVTARVEEVKSATDKSIKSRKAYFAVSYSPDYYPNKPEIVISMIYDGTTGESTFLGYEVDLTPSRYSAVTGIAICGLAVTGNTGYWTEEQPIPEEGEYVWIMYLVTTVDDEVYWEDPILLSDEAARKSIDYMSERYAEITVSLDEINLEIHSLYSDYDYTLEQFSDINMTLDSITSTVYQLELNLNDSVNTFSEKYSQISQDLESINLYVQDVESTVGGLQSLVSSIDVELGSITTRVESTENGLSSCMKSRKAYYAISYSPDYYPSRESLEKTVEGLGDDDELIYIWDTTNTAICGSAVCGFAVCGNTGLWTSERPTNVDSDAYIWISYYVTLNSGETYWEDPILLSDDVARKQIAQIQVELDSITMSVYDTVDGMAMIRMTVGDNTSEAEVVTKAREAFAASDSSIIIAAGTITFYDGTLVIEGGNFSLDADGNAVFGGTLTSPGGMIGGFTIGTDSIYTTTDTFGSGSENIYIGIDGISLGTTFKVTSEGTLTCTSGNIGNWTITSSSIQTGSYNTSGTMYFGSSGLSLGTTFRVDSSGSLTATSGTVGGWTLSSSAIYSGTSSMTSTTVGTYIGQSGFRQYSSSTAYTNIQNGNITCYSFSGNVISINGSALSSIANLTITSSIYLGTSSSSSTTLYSYAACYFYNEVWCQTSFGGSRTRQPLGSNNTVGNRAWSISTYSSSVHVYGDCGTSGGSNTWTNSLTLSASSSDARLKDNIVSTSIDNALELLLSMNYYSFDWKADGSHEKIGFIAQQLQKVDSCLILPQIDDEPLAINMISLAAITAKSIQELYEFTMDRDDNLQLQIDDLKAENKALKEELAAIKAA